MALDELNLSLAAVRIPCAAAVKDGASEFEAGLTGDSWSAVEWMIRWLSCWAEILDLLEGKSINCKFGKECEEHHLRFVQQEQG